MQLTDTTKRHLALAGILLAVFVIGGVSGKYLARSKYQPRSGLYAIFLTNNQVYFGNLDKESRNTVVLKNIYYVQTKQPVDKDQDIALLKLGNELHGPEDMMEINREHVLFIEKLKADSRVAKAIAGYKK